MALKRAMEILEGAAAAAAKDRPVAGRLTLDYDGRTKTRQLAVLDDGQEIALALPRGTVLEHGQRLLCSDGSMVEVAAAFQTLSRVLTADPLTLARAAYHLGNRHVPVQITAEALYYQHDHVLDGMVRALGLEVETVSAPFQPEGGAYQGHSHDRAGAGIDAAADPEPEAEHDHDHDHDHPDPGARGHHHRQGQGHGPHHHDHGHGHGPHPQGRTKPRRG